jgi:hypothetical protein
MTSTGSKRSSGFHVESSHDGVDPDTAIRPSSDAMLNVTSCTATSVGLAHHPTRVTGQPMRWYGPD